MWPYPEVIAHRGGGSLAPENTMAALRCGLARGFRGVEFDVMLSSDQVPVLMHDERFARTVAAPGSVPRTSLAALQAMDAGSWFGPDFVGESVPSYEEAATFCMANDMWMNVEIKPAAGFERVTGEVVALRSRELCQQWGSPPPLLASFSEAALLAARAATPEIPRALLVSRLPFDWRARMDAADAVSLHIDHKALTPQIVAQVHAAGYGLFCYTVNSPARATVLLQWGIDAFCTDRIDLIGPDFSARR